MRALTITGVSCLAVGACLMAVGHLYIITSLTAIGGIIVGSSVGIFALRKVCQENPAVLTEIEKLDRR